MTEPLPSLWPYSPEHLAIYNRAATRLRGLFDAARLHDRHATPNGGCDDGTECPLTLAMLDATRTSERAIEVLGMAMVELAVRGYGDPDTGAQP